jgi:hypothetical protein
VEDAVSHNRLFGDGLRFLVVVSLIDIGVFASVALACWFGGWCTLAHYGTGLTTVGAAAIAVGALDLVARVRYQHAVSSDTVHFCGRVECLLGAMAQSHALLMVGTSGIVSIIFGEVIRTSVAHGI